MKKIRKLFTTLIISMFLAIGIPVVFPMITNTTVVQAATIRISNKSIYLDVGEKFRLKILGTNKKVKWKSSKPKYVSVGSKGLITAKKPGTVRIVGTVGGKRYTCIVTVGDYDFPEINDNDIGNNNNDIGNNNNDIENNEFQFSASTTSLDINQYGQVYITYNGGGSVRYEIDNTSICSCEWSKVWNDNVATLYVHGYESGSTFITITNTTNSQKIIIEVNVDRYVKTIELNATQKSMTVGETFDLTANIYPDYALMKYVDWSSSNSDVAYINFSGKVEARSAGTAIITATSRDGKASAQCEITVSSPVTIQMPLLPKEINNYSYNGSIKNSCLITDARYEFSGTSYSTTCTVYLDGEKTYEQKGAGQSAYTYVGYKLYRNDVVVKSGMIIIYPTAIGDKFVDCKETFYNLTPGTYQLELIDYRM